MSSGVTGPTVLYGADAFGAKVLAFITDSLGEPDPLLATFQSDADQFAAGLSARLDELLRAGRAPADSPGARLDAIAFASAEQGELVAPCAAMAKVLAERYSVVFPADASPSQRTARLHVVVKVPPLGTPAGNEALRRVGDLEAWALGQPAFPLLARIWVISRNTTGGVLSEQEVVAACGAFALATIASGVRTEEAIQERMAFQQGDGLVSMLSAACRDLPVSQLRDYAAERATYDAVERLISRIGRQATDATVADGTVRSLDASGWLRPFVDGPPAQRSKRLTAGLSGMEARLPEVRVGPLMRPEKIREEYAELFAPASRERLATAVEGGEFEEVMKHLDQAEAETLVGFHGRLDALLERELDPTGGLSRLPELEFGLRRLRDGMADDQQRDLLSAPGAQEGDPGRTELEGVYARLPRPTVVWASALAIGLAFALTVLGVVHTLGASPQAAPPSPPPVFSAPAIAGAPAAPAPPVAGVSDLQLAMPWLIAALTLGLGAFGWALLVGKLTRKDLKIALERRRGAIELLRAQGGAGWGRTQGDYQLTLRKRRLRAGAYRGVERALAHIQAVRRQLIAARDELRQRIVARNIGIGPDAARDDLGGLLGKGELMVAPLIGTEPLARWIARCRETAETDVWASRLLQGAWAQAGLLEDVPCADLNKVLELGRAETVGVRRRSLFDDEAASAAAASALRDLVFKSGALAPPCLPRDASDDPAPCIRGGETLVLAPDAAREPVEQAARDAGHTVKVLRVAGTSPRVLFIRTWEGLNTQSVARGGARRPAASTST